MTEDTRHVGEHRCWPCTVANAAVGLLVAGVPLAASLIVGDLWALAAAVAWAAAICLFTGYHLIERGYLPGSAHVAQRTGLEVRIGPGRETDVDENRDTR